LSVCALLATLAAGAVAIRADFQSAMNAAMGPYYAALIASERGDAESTQRNLVMLAARWDRVAREAAPAALKADPAWRAAVDRGAAIITRCQELVRARNLTALHLELEGLRLVLRQVRGKHNLLVLDDWLTDYHESMERVHVRASMHNEIVLADADYAEMTKDLNRAKSLWAIVERDAGTIASTPGWLDAARRLGAAQAELEHLLVRKDPAAIARAAGRLTDAYHDLLGALSRASRE
jgi:hypothetical protein